MFFICFIITPYVYAEKKLIPGGEVIGISMESDGLLVTGTIDVTSDTGEKINPAEKADIKSGDRLISVDGIKIAEVNQLTEYVKNHKNDIVLTLKRNNKNINTVITPVLSGDSYKLGIKVKAGACGIGTISFIDPDTKKFVALGHGISDLETNTLIKCKSGKIQTCSLTEPTKGKRGNPGELNGKLESDTLGRLYANTPNGIFGKLENFDFLSNREEMPVADFSEIKSGEAYILSDLDGKQLTKYTINIKKAEKGNLEGKNIVFKVTDEELINKTGGIIQGMSGSPILQNGKIIGAVTHVFVNDPTRGYGIFIENMLAEAEKIK